MKRYACPVIVCLLVAAVVILYVRLERLTGEVRGARPLPSSTTAPAYDKRVMAEDARLSELRTRRLELDLYRQQINVGIKPKGKQPYLSDADLAELAELEKRAARRAVDRLAD